MYPLISVVIAVFNEEKYIGNCLSSLMKQEYKPLQIIIVDDGSTDKTKEIIKNKVSVFELKHQGTALARNFGVSKAKGQIIVFLDADMEFPHNFISKLIAPIQENKAKGTFSKLEYVKNWDNPLSRCWNRNNSPPLPDTLRVRSDIKYGDDFRAILKSEFIKVNGFDNTGYTDTWTLSKKLGYKPINAEGALYYHNNPETYKEVFASAQWIGKRKYKIGKLGEAFVIFKSFFLLSFLKGCLKAIKYSDWQFVPFQMIYDLGITFGILQKIITKKIIK